MAGELLIRLLDYEMFNARTAQGLKPDEAARGAFLDHDRWSLVDPIGLGWVVIDGSAFYTEVPELYEGHDAMSVLLEDEETATLIVPDDVVARWRDCVIPALPGAPSV